MSLAWGTLALERSACGRCREDGGWGDWQLPDYQQEAQWALDEEWQLFLGIRGERTEGIPNVGRQNSLLLP